MACELACVVLSLRTEPGLVGAVRSVLASAPRPEVVVVDSGGGDVERALASAGLEVPSISRPEPLYPGAVRNLGVAATSARYVAFLAADCIAEPGWVEGRLRRHRAGAAAVASAVTNAYPGSGVARASSMLLFHTRRPCAPPGERQLYGASYDRALFDRFGPFREDVRKGEDTDFHSRLEGEVSIEWAPEVRTAHRHPTRLLDLLRDQWARGRLAGRGPDGLGGTGEWATGTGMLRSLPWRMRSTWRDRGEGAGLPRIGSFALLPAAAMAYAVGAELAGERRTDGRPDTRP
jgi:glycosyltransferase involved in cell wall biosynthesis